MVGRLRAVSVHETRHPEPESSSTSKRLLSLDCFIETCDAILVVDRTQFTFENSSELFIFPRVDDDVCAGVEDQEEM